MLNFAGADLQSVRYNGNIFLGPILPLKTTFYGPEKGQK